VLRYLSIALALATLSPVSSPAQTAFRFTDQTTAAGIEMRQTFGGPEKRYILESHGSGAAFFDHDNDGDLDLYVVNGSTFENYAKKSGPGNFFYHNNGDGTFAEIGAAAGVNDAGWGAGCAVGDYDNDGDRDLYVTNYGANQLYRNGGNGTFTATGAAAGNDYSAGTAFFDYDNDGDLDLYVANYVEFSRQRMPDAATQAELCVFVGGVQVYCGPKGMPAAADRLYRNDGDGDFTDVTDQTGIAAANRYYGLGVVPEDFDQDGDTDLFVANDETPNVLFDNNGDGTFSDIALFAGTAYNGEGDAEAGMGVDAGDYDNDGDADLYVTHFFRETNTLYRNESQRPSQDTITANRQSRFSDATISAHLAAPTVSLLGWGTKFFDANNDGHLDLFVANGHVYPQVDQVETGSTYRQPNQLFVNSGAGTFVDQSALAGLHAMPAKVSRGASFGDYDNDGDLDIFVVELNDTPSLLRNDSAPQAGVHHWLAVRLFGQTSNRDGAGARLRLKSGDTIQWRTLNGAASYLSHNDLRVYFGLGKATKVEELQIRWPDGTVHTLKDLPADRLIALRQDGTHRVLDLGTATNGDWP
jgi:enediyne biosynthesis protein E4